MDSESLQNTPTLNDFTPETIRAQLHRILQSSIFRNAVQAKQFLSFVVESTLSGETHRIKQYTIAVDAIGHSPDFDPITNPAMRILGGRVRLMLERYYMEDGQGDDLRIVIPKGRYIPVFQFTTQARVQTISPETTERNLISDYGLSLAVIPFSNLISDINNTFADNITESIVMGLTNFSELHVIGPVREYKDCAIRIDEIRQRYRVRFVLEGRVQRYGKIVRISAGLTDALSGFKIWKQLYEYPQTDVSFQDVEDDVSKKLVNALANYSGIIPRFISRESMRKASEVLEVYEAVSLYEQYLKIFTPQALLASTKALEHAVKVDPDNPVALAMLSHAYGCNYWLDLGLEPASLEEAERLVERAVALDPECQLAHISEAFLRYLQRKTDQCIEKMQFLNSLNPLNAYVIHSAGIMTYFLGHYEEGLCMCGKAINLNPHHTPVYFIVQFLEHYRHSNYKEAWVNANRFNTVIFWDPLMRAAAAGQLGLYEDATVALHELLEMRPDFPRRAWDLMRRVVYLDEHVEMLLDGLSKAGFKVDSSPIKASVH
jgi:adenylate cyclase